MFRSGTLVPMTSRSGLAELFRRFDISWFLGAIHKYRYLLGALPRFFPGGFMPVLATFSSRGRQSSGQPHAKHSQCSQYRLCGSFDF